jgi:regulator of RNase E activity RraA
MASGSHGVPEGVTCASLVDALGKRYSHRAHIMDLVTPSPGRVLFGPAVTIAFVPYREDLHDERRHTFASMFYEAVRAEPAGKVLVLSSGGHPDAAHAGGTKLYRAETNRLAGVLADGRVRDFAELAEFDMVTYCRGEATRAGGSVVMPYEANVAVEVGGVTIQPGDYLYVDPSGGVVVPAADLDEVVEVARAVEAEDVRTLARIRQEGPGEHQGAAEV